MDEKEREVVSEEVVDKLIQESGRQHRELGRQYSSLTRDSAKTFWVVTGVGLVALAVGTALWMEYTSQEKNDKPKTEYHSPTYSSASTGLTPQNAYLKDGTSYKFYIVDNKIAVTEIGGKPIIDSLEGKLRK